MKIAVGTWTTDEISSFIQIISELKEKYNWQSINPYWGLVSKQMTNRVG